MADKNAVPFDEKVISDDEDTHHQLQQLKEIAGKKTRQRSRSKKLFDNMYHWSVGKPCYKI